PSSSDLWMRQAKLVPVILHEKLLVEAALAGGSVAERDAVVETTPCAVPNLALGGTGAPHIDGGGERGIATALEASLHVGDLGLDGAGVLEVIHDVLERRLDEGIAVA